MKKDIIMNIMKIMSQNMVGMRSNLVFKYKSFPWKIYLVNLLKFMWANP